MDCILIATFLERSDPAKALDLYNRAGALDPNLANNPVYYVERAELAQRLGRLNYAEEDLRRALAADNRRARYHLADVLARKGRYAEAHSLLLADDGGASIAYPPYRLVSRALRHIVEDWGIEEQSRPSVVTRPPQGQDAAESLALADAAVRDDALNGWAHWARCPALEQLGQLRLDPLIAAAVGVRDVPQIWDELIRLAIVEEDWGLAEDALWSAREFTEDGFVEMLLTDEFLEASGNRASMTWLFESIPDRGPRYQQSLLLQ